MKKNLRLFIIVAILGVVALYSVLKNSTNTIKEELRDFAVSDTAAVNKIFLADRNGNSVLLVRKNMIWTLNDSLPIRTDLLHHLLDAIHRISVKAAVPKATYNNLVKNLSVSGIKCEIYIEGQSQPYKTYYVGGETQDNLGTYMILENSSVPFITEIPGFNGYLSPRYSPNVEDWKVPIVFSFDPDSIRSVEVNYPAFPERSFTIERQGHSFRVFNPVTKLAIAKVDSVAVNNYLIKFKGVFYEGLMKNLTASKQDSLRTTIPLNEIKVITESGQQRDITTYPMPINQKSLVLQDSLGNPFKYDVDRMYGYMHRSNEWVSVQHYNFDGLFRELADFDLHKGKRSIKAH